jgi:predicted acyltransferase
VPVPEIAAPPARIESLDIFRGATIASMILVNDPGTWNAIYEPFEHAEWHGWTFTDTVFPFFLWIVGVSITLSFSKRVARGDDRSRLLLHVLRRSALLVLIGLMLGLVPRFDFAHLRYPGVLQRIGVCYLLASAIFLCTETRGRIAWTVGLLALYWVLMLYVPVPGYGPGHLEPVGNFAQWIDSIVLNGHMWSSTKVWDPEGLLSTLPAIATVLLGILAGQLLQTKSTPERKASWMFLGGNALMLAGLILSAWMPINKKIWTCSFTLFMAGLAAVVFATWYWIVDVQGWKRWAKPFQVFGMNAIAAYVLAGIVARILLNSKTGDRDLWRVIYEGLFAPVAPPRLASLLFAIVFVLVIYAMVYAMYRRRWFLKL